MCFTAQTITPWYRAGLVSVLGHSCFMVLSVLFLLQSLIERVFGPDPILFCGCFCSNVLDDTAIQLITCDIGIILGHIYMETQMWISAKHITHPIAFSMLINFLYALQFSIHVVGPNCIMLADNILMSCKQAVGLSKFKKAEVHCINSPAYGFRMHAWLVKKRPN